MASLSRTSFHNSIFLLIATSGFATLSWEVLWQIKSTFALGVSGWATAITLAIMMGGMSLGSYFMGNILDKNSHFNPLRIFGLLEILIGLTGLFLKTAFNTIEKIDTWIYNTHNLPYSSLTILGIIVVLCIPTLCMGATLPVFRLISNQYQLSITKLYSTNTLGAALGALMVAILIIPFFGVNNTVIFIASINIICGIATWSLKPHFKINNFYDPVVNNLSPLTSQQKIFIVLVTGFATFTIEIAWFRSLATIFPNTTDVFAIMLTSMLIALGLAARSITKLKQTQKSLGNNIILAGILILVFTPLIERLDTFLFSLTSPQNVTNIQLSGLINSQTFSLLAIATFIYILQITLILFLICFLIVPPMRSLGLAFPWIIDHEKSPQIIGRLYAINSVSAIVGAISAGWILLPTIGFARTSWIAGILVLIAGLTVTPKQRRLTLSLLGILALSFAIFFETGVGRMRIQGDFAIDTKGNPGKILEYYEGPDATVSALEYKDGARILLINSTLAALESGYIYQPSIHYMAWMGHLPMLLHEAPKNALVICFGTGQTANAIRKEHAESIDIVDINPHVYKLSHHFKSNENILQDPKVNAIVMDGRIFMRRTKKVYDVISLEPMPPITNGANALYAKEFYELARSKLSSHGVLAQWLPFHNVAPHYAASIVKTFQASFPNAILWIDMESKTGILLGTKDDKADLANAWPGFNRVNITRNLSNEKVRQSIGLTAKQLALYGSYGELITDDNQLLAYGKALYVAQNLAQENFKLLHRINTEIKYTNSPN